jgi:tRNA pseudouridine(55) synthase
MFHMKPSIVLEKKVGETPLSRLEDYREAHPELAGVPMAYAGRLDPMASGKLLVLLGEECKVQEKYHNLDKEYEFEVLFGVGSDSGDVLGLLEKGEKSTVDVRDIKAAIKTLVGAIELPYPHFSSKTVKGKPLHTWKVEGRIDEVAIPTKRSTIYKLALENTQIKTAQEVYRYATEKIETIPKVTDERKALGNDFRRDDVRESWKHFLDTSKEQQYTVARFTCICSSGTYMRTLASVIAEKLGTKGLAYSIHRTKIGTYAQLPFGFSAWTKLF